MLHNSPGHEDSCHLVCQRSNSSDAREKRKTNENKEKGKNMHGDKLAGQYFSVVLRERNASAFSIQPYWRAAARAWSFVAHKKRKTMKTEK